MKKGFAVVLALVLVLGLCASALAAPFYLESAGVTIDVPDGYTAQDMSDEVNNVLAITDDADSTVAYVFTVGYIEEFEGKALTDLSPEEAEQLGMGIGSAIENVSIGEAEVNGIPMLIVAAGDGTQLHYISLLNGWLYDVACAKNDGVQISDAQIAVTAQLVSSVTLDTDDAQAEEAA